MDNDTPVDAKALNAELLSNTYKFDFDDLEQWVNDGCPEGVSGKADDVRALIAFARHRTTSLAALEDKHD